ncbi:MAG TPA: hypothetical protein VK277_04005 [Acidimicrobiales bacterium]|nr:hypothetical protein [Acidimicrobiales bacterium]
MAVETNGRKITRADLESAFAGAIGTGEEKIRSSTPVIAVAAAAAGVAVVVLAYWAGRRRGRRRTAVVEIRRL